jgi:sulfur-oxidizing protein SoxA
MQADDAQNPAFLWVAQGRALYAQPPAPGQPDCAQCHGADAAGLRGAAARHPAWDPATQRPLPLAGRIEQCRQRHQAQPLRDPEHDDALALQAFVALQSRGQPQATPAGAGMAAWVQQGAALYRQRRGQLDLACADCHDARAGGLLGGSLIPQAHPTGYPQYRLQWQTLGGLDRRLRNCSTGVRASPLSRDEHLALQAYLAQRAAGLLLDAPAVRP